MKTNNMNIARNRKITGQKIRNAKRLFGLCGVATGLALTALAQAPKAASDVLELNDGERLIGHLVSGSGGSFTFHSDAAGDVKIAWKDV